MSSAPDFFQHLQSFRSRNVLKTLSASGRVWRLLIDRDPSRIPLMAHANHFPKFFGGHTPARTKLSVDTGARASDRGETITVKWTPDGIISGCHSDRFNPLSKANKHMILNLL